MTSLHRVPPFPSWNSLLILFSWIQQSDIWELFEGYGEKVNILRQKLERTILRNCIVMCECNSQSYKVLFCDEYPITVSLKSAMGYCLAQWSSRWKRKYPQKKTRENLSYKLLGNVWIHLTELHSCFMEQAINTVFQESEKGYFGWHWGVRWYKKYHP